MTENTSVNNDTLKEFINRHSLLWWWVPDEKKENLSLKSVVGAILNYGSLSDIKELFELFGLTTVADVFYEATNNQQRSNYSPEIENFFKLYFERHA